MAGRKQTFLHKAVMCADVNFVNVVITTAQEEHGGQEVEKLLHLEDMDGNTPLLLAVKRKSPEIIEVLKLFVSFPFHHNLFIRKSRSS